MTITTNIVSVRLDELVPYDHNPRATRNPKFDVILESIENTGLEHPPSITRRSPEDPHYMIIDGGNTRLEILNLLYEKYTRLAESAKSDEERLAHSSKAESFFIIDCTFKPWVSESRALTGHMSENENRGDMLFIEKALAVQKLRQFYEAEDREKARESGVEYEDKPLSMRQLAKHITANGWSVSPSHLSRYDYATNTLLDAIQAAFWSGAGHPLVRQVRKYDVAYTRFWQSTETGQAEPERIESLFFDTLRRYDGESVDLQSFVGDLNAQLGNLLDLHPSTVTVEVEAIMNGSYTSPTPQEPPGLSPKELVRKYKESAPPGLCGVSNMLPADSHTGSKTSASGGDTQQKALTKKTKQKSRESEENIKVKLFGTVHALANKYGIDIVHFTPEERGGSDILFGVSPIDRAFIPGEDEELATVWWALTKYSLSYRGDQPNRYAGFSVALKEQFGGYFDRLGGPLGTLLFFEEAIRGISTEIREEIRDQLHEIQRLCGLIIQETAEK